jgi:HK97 family phage major capsid protein
MEKIKELETELRGIIDEMKTVNARTQSDGTLSADDQQKWNDLSKREDGLKENLRREMKMREVMKEEAERIARDEQTRHTQTQRGETPTYEQVFDRYVRGVSLTSDERSVLNIGAEKRAPQTITTSGGGYLIPQGYIQQIEKRMIAIINLLDPGLTYVFNTESGNPLPMPTIDDTSNNGAALAINTAATEQEFAFGEVKFGAYKYTSQYVRVPFELLQDTQFDIQSLIAEQFAARFGRQYQSVLTNGNGSTAPQGIVTGSTLGKETAATNAITRNELVDLVHSLDIAYRPNAVFFMHDATIAALKKLAFGTGDDRPLWQRGDISQLQPDTLEGYPVYANNAMDTIAAAKKVILFADPKKFWVRKVGNMRMRISDDLNMLADQITYVAFDRIDSKVIQANAVKHLITKA